MKTALRAMASSCTCPPKLPVCLCGKVSTLELLHRRALRPSEAEVAHNPRARSTRLRAAKRLCRPKPVSDARG